MSDEEDLFARWSARRQAVAKEASVEAVPAPEPEHQDPEKSEEDILAELGLPDPDELGEGDDFSGFMSEGIPAALRQRALRRLWRLNPVLANVDGLVEYGEDYTDAATVIPDLKTAYKVGKGIVRRLLEDPDEAEEEEIQVAEAEENGPAEPELEPEDDPQPEAYPAEELQDDPLPEPRPRRMTFRIASEQDTA